VTLLEVMIAILVLAIGILGLAALIPVGKWEIARTNQYDRSSTTGNLGYRDLQIRGFLNPDMWVYPNNGSPKGVLSGVPGSPSPSTYTAGAVPGMTISPPFVPFVLDPLLVSTNTSSTGKRAVSTFPYQLTSPLVSGAPVLPRITLRSYAGSNLTISAPLADRIFRSADELTFGLPNDDTSFKPQAAFMYLPTVSATLPTKLQSDGATSWFATISPDIGQAIGGVTSWGGAVGPSGGGASAVRQYVISVAACCKREITDLGNVQVAGPFQPTGERTVNITFPALQGGSMVSNTADAWLWAPGFENEGQAEQFLAVQADQWIMVAGYGTNYAGSASPTPQVVMNWYRVSAAAPKVEQQPDTGNMWSRQVRLVGPDWVLQPVSGNASAYAFLVDGVMNVFQKTLVQDGNSVFSY
jgi:hypothetical protein